MEQRTSQQNKALHLFCTQLAEALNDAGLDMRVVLKEEVEIPWTMETIKDFLWKGVQQAYLGKEHTAELTTKQVSEVHKILMRHLGEKFGVDLEFPSIPDEQ